MSVITFSVRLILVLMMASISSVFLRKGLTIITLSQCSRRTCSNLSAVKCKIALITGGSVGIGYAFAESLLRCGARGVMLGDIRVKEGEEAAKCLCKKYGENKAFFQKTDVTKKDEFENLFKCTKEKYHQLDIVINNAGLLQDKNWELEIDVNVKGVVRGTLLGFEYMGKHKDGGGGAIVNVASIYGLQQAHGCPVYNGTKAFVVRFSDAMSHPYYDKLTGVKVFTICPGVTETNMIDESEKYALEGFGNLGKILKDGLADLPSQPAEMCGRCLIKILCRNENGSIFVIEDCECYKVELPDRQCLRV